MNKVGVTSIHECPRSLVFSETQLALPVGWVLIDLGGLKVVPIAACWTRVPVLDSGERGLERDPDYTLESPVLVLRVILRP